MTPMSYLLATERTMCKFATLIIIFIIIVVTFHMALDTICHNGRKSHRYRGIMSSNLIAVMAIKRKEGNV